MGAVGLFDYEIYNFTKITFHLANMFSKSALPRFYDIILHKWYFCELNMIK